MTKLSHVNRALGTMISKATTSVSLAVQKTNPLDAETARVLVVIPRPHQPYISETAMAEAVEAQFSGVRYLPNSLHREAGRDTTLFGCFVTKRNRSVSMEHASAAGIRAVTDTVFQDAEDNVWTKMGEGAGAYLVAQRDEDIMGLLGAVQTRAIATASVGLSLEEDFARNDAVYFYDTVKECASFGIAVDGRRVYNTEDHVLQDVAAQQVVFVQTGAGLPEVARDKVGADKKALLDYMRMLYGHNTAIYARIKQIITKELSV